MEYYSEIVSQDILQIYIFPDLKRKIKFQSTDTPIERNFSIETSSTTQ